MILKFHQATTDAGGAIGQEVGSGWLNAFLPKIDTQDMVDGINIFRKLYVKNIGSDGVLKISISGLGLFNASIFPSTGDAQVVGDLTGTEARFGASVVSKVIDSDTNQETSNGVGGLTDIKKVVVSKNQDFVFFRVGETVRVGNYFSTIQTITDLSTDYELELTNAVPYDYLIGKTVSSMIEETITATNHASYWVNIFIQAGSITAEHMNEIDIITASEGEI